MLAYRPSAAIALMFAASACSGAAMSPESAEPPRTDATPAKAPLYSFEGAVDVASGSMTVTFRTPTGALATQATLPYGNAPGSVFFHTCTPAPVFDTTAHTLTGNVQAVNLMTGTVGGLTAVIDSVSLAGVTPASGTIATYGAVAPNAADCASTQPWVFTNPSNGNFTFAGHADGDLGTEHIVNGDFESGTGSTACGSGNFMRTGWVATGSGKQSGACVPYASSMHVTITTAAAGTFSQSFAATTGVGVLTYQRGSHANVGTCTHTVTFGPSNTAFTVTQNPVVNALTAAAPISVPTGTTSVKFGPVSCTGSALFATFDNVSLIAP